MRNWQCVVSDSLAAHERRWFDSGKITTMTTAKRHPLALLSHNPLLFLPKLGEARGKMRIYSSHSLTWSIFNNWNFKWLWKKRERVTTEQKRKLDGIKQGLVSLIFLNKIWYFFSRRTVYVYFDDSLIDRRRGSRSLMKSESLNKFPMYKNNVEIIHGCLKGKRASDGTWRAQGQHSKAESNLWSVNSPKLEGGQRKIVHTIRNRIHKIYQFPWGNPSHSTLPLHVISRKLNNSVSTIDKNQ